MKRWIAIDIGAMEGTENHNEGKMLFTKEIPIDKKYHCELCKKKPHIYVVDDQENEVKLFCNWAHLNKFIGADEK